MDHDLRFRIQADLEDGCFIYQINQILVKCNYMDMHGNWENKTGYVYGSLLLIILTVPVIFLMCDFDILPAEWCRRINLFNNSLTLKVNEFLGIK